MIFEYLIELIGPVPIYLETLVYLLSFILVMFGLWCVIYLIAKIFSKFF